jgi:hypothetical protein
VVKMGDEKKNNYWPLIVVVLISLMGSVAIQEGRGDFSLMFGMHYAMGIFLSIFAMFKIFNLQGFVDGFSMYDLVVKKFKPYGYVYPFIELGLGLAYLSFFRPNLTYVVTIIVMLVGAVGVIKTLRKGMNIKCACLGTVLDVPLSTVAVVEDFGMALMALIMLFM